MVERDKKQRLLRLTARQHGIFTRAQAISIGYTPTEILRLRRRGAILTLRRGLYAIAGAPHTWERRAWSAVLAAGEGAVLSHLAAAWCLGLTEKEPSRFDVVVPHTRRPTSRVRRATALGRGDTAVARGFRVTCPSRTLVDLAGLLPPASLEGVLDRALLAGRTTPAALRRYVVMNNLAHRPGVGRLMKLIADREADGIPESELERAFERLLRRFALPPRPTRQFRTGSYRVDFLFADQKVLVELDGRAAHSTREAFERDRARQNELVLEHPDHLILRFTWDQVTKHDGCTAHTLRRALDR